MYPDLKSYYRTFPHSNSYREDAARYDSDVQEMEEEGVSSNCIPKLRDGKHGRPDCYDDVPRHDATKTWETKPKGTRHRKRDTIRRPQVEEEPATEEADDEMSS